MIKLHQLQEGTKAFASDCSDTFAQSAQIDFDLNNRVNIPTASLFQGASIQATLTDWAFNQIGTRMGAPVSWMNSQACPDAMKAGIMNDLCHTYRDDTKLFVRLKGDNVRAVLSKEYSVFDNVEMVDLIAQAVSTMGIEPEIHRAVIGDDFRAYVIFPQVTIGPDPKGSEGLHPALYVGNSERGGGSARVCGATFIDRCTNGTIYGYKADSAFSLRHRFKSHNLMLSLMTEAVAEGLRMSEEATLKFIESQNVHIEVPSLRNIVDSWASRYGLSLEASTNWLSAVTNESIENGRQNDPRLIDVINGATLVAQGRPQAEMELMERVAGDMLFNNMRETRRRNSREVLDSTEQ